jgi:beta-galactosidase
MGKELANGEAKEIQIVAGQSAETKCELVLDHPALWSVESPNLYVLVTTVRHGGASLDTLKTTFGVRSLAFDKDRGFFLNGKHLLIKGVCCHQDHAGVGVALPDPLQEFRVRRLKEMGANALRTSHNRSVCSDTVAMSSGLSDAGTGFTMKISDSRRSTSSLSWTTSRKAAGKWG